MPLRRRVEIKSQRRVLDDVFKLDEMVVSHRRYDGKMSSDQRRLIFERGDAAAALLVNVDVRSVVLVEQFRAPAMIGRRRDDPGTTDGWITEVVAGTVGPNETPEAAVVRETFEETGYRIERPELIGRFFSSPGGTSERVFLYFATVSESARPEKGGGLGDEDISVSQVGVEELFDRLAKGQIEDPKLVIAAHWLQANLARIETAPRAGPEGKLGSM